MGLCMGLQKGLIEKEKEVSARSIDTAIPPTSMMQVALTLGVTMMMMVSCTRPFFAVSFPSSERVVN